MYCFRIVVITHTIGENEKGVVKLMKKRVVLRFTNFPNKTEIKK